MLMYADVSIRYIPRSKIAGSKDKYICSYQKYCQNVLSGDCILCPALAIYENTFYPIALEAECVQLFDYCQAGN